MMPWKTTHTSHARHWKPFIIELVFCRELTIEQAAAVMGVTTGTDRETVYRGRRFAGVDLLVSAERRAVTEQGI